MDAKKSLYQWTFTDFQRFEANTVLETFARGGRSVVISSHMLRKLQVDVDVPNMSLGATAEFFVNKLSPEDRQTLASTLQSLNGKCITFGSTCSGTDVIVPVMKLTFETLSRMFQVPSSTTHALGIFRYSTVCSTAFCFS